jgi:hypothetical protein
MVAEYLEKALNFEQLAAKEKDAALKVKLLAQAAAYRKMAAERALRDPLTPPSSPSPSDTAHKAKRSPRT